MPRFEMPIYASGGGYQKNSWPNAYSLSWRDFAQHGYINAEIKISYGVKGDV